MTTEELIDLLQSQYQAVTDGSQEVDLSHLPESTIRECAELLGMVDWVFSRELLMMLEREHTRQRIDLAYRLISIDSDFTYSALRTQIEFNDELVSDFCFVHTALEALRWGLLTLRPTEAEVHALTEYLASHIDELPSYISIIRERLTFDLVLIQSVMDHCQPLRDGAL